MSVVLFDLQRSSAAAAREGEHTPAEVRAAAAVSAATAAAVCSFQNT
jgi:hypothetical protein